MAQSVAFLSDSHILSERWRAVEGYDSLYEVSDQGRVRKFKTRRLLRPFLDNGSLRIDLSGPNGRRRHSVADLVAKTFLPPAPRGCVAGHKSDDTGDNRVGNLEWLTQAENSARWFRRQGRPRGPDGSFLSRVMDELETAAVHESQTEGWR